jgi:Protein of unknown function (DUF3108)
LRSPWRESWRRRAAWFGLILAVLLAHLLFAVRMLPSVIGWNTAPEPKRIAVTFTRQIRPAAPPAVAAAAPPPAAPAPRTPHGVRSARASATPVPASGPEEPEFHPTPPGAPSESRAQLVGEALTLASKLEKVERTREAAEAASAAQAAAAEIAAAAASATVESHAVAAVTGPPRPPFEWPPATRLSYTLTGEHGVGIKIYGHATVEWRHEDSRYQVQFDVHITPLIDQHMYSDGTLGADGLSPQHYDESFSFLFATPRVRRIEFGENEVTLNNGSRVAKLPQTQDGASQFVQFVWMFYSHPEWLTPGNIVQIPLALPNNLRRWNYMVVGHEQLQLAFGALDAVHLKPLLDGPRRPNEYPFDIWTAPTLQYLPVQIVVRVDEHTWALLALDDLPLQAAGERPSAPAPTANPFPPPPAIGER